MVAAWSGRTGLGSGGAAVLPAPGRAFILPVVPWDAVRGTVQDRTFPDHESIFGEVNTNINAGIQRWRRISVIKNDGIKLNDSNLTRIPMNKTSQYRFSPMVLNFSGVWKVALDF